MSLKRDLNFGKGVRSNHSNPLYTGLDYATAVQSSSYKGRFFDDVIYLVIYLVVPNQQ